MSDQVDEIGRDVVFVLFNHIILIETILTIVKHRNSNPHLTTKKTVTFHYFHC